MSDGRQPPKPPPPFPRYQPQPPQPRPNPQLPPNPQPQLPPPPQLPPNPQLPPQPYPQPQPQPVPAPAPVPAPVPAPAPYPPSHALTTHRTHLSTAVPPPQGTGFGALALLSLRRALRLRIEANEVLDDERRTMLALQPPIADETQQAFLAWRRSVLLLAAMLMVPVAILHAIETFDSLKGMPGTLQTLLVLPILVEIGFVAFLWMQVPKWTAWRRQSRALAIAWLLSFATPFLVFLYPWASAFDLGQMDPTEARAARVGLGLVVGAAAVISLAPQIISLLQGLIRASIATKTLFPGASAPGWLMVLAPPLYMIVFYVIAILPYHFAGNGFVAVGMLLVIAANASLVKSGLHLARPMTPEAARAASTQAQHVWTFLLVAGVLCLIGGLWDLVKAASVKSMASFALSLAAHTLVLTLIATDAIIAALDRARGVTPEERALADASLGEVATFTATRE
jgi:hypothetical protein